MLVKADLANINRIKHQDLAADVDRAEGLPVCMKLKLNQPRGGGTTHVLESITEICRSQFHWERQKRRRTLSSAAAQVKKKSF